MSAVDPIRDHRGWAFTGDEGTDLDSLNGTHVNGERINGKARLNDGDLI